MKDRPTVRKIAMTFIPEIETIARHEIDERIRRRQRLASPGRRQVRRRAASALRHLADTLSPAV
jgi:hypothetical protein